MSKNMADDYFSIGKSNRDGTLSPYSANMLSQNTPGLHSSLSWNDAPEYAGLTRSKSHTGNVIYRSVGVSKAQSDTKVYPYHTIHLTTPVPPNLKPSSPEDVLARITGKCIQCSSINSKKVQCPHLSSDSASVLSNNSNYLTSPTRRSKDFKIKSILSRKGNKSTQIESHFSNSVSFDTVNLRFSDDLNNYPLSSFSSEDDSDEDDEDSNTDCESRGRSAMSSSLLSTGISPQSRFARNSSRSPSRSLSPSTKSLPSIDMVTEKENNIKNFFSLKYPTSPIITHDACTLTRKHKLFDDMYANRLKSLEPKLHNRVIMCYVSGRKHTWVGIDWACNQLLEDGDSLIIVSSIKNPGRSLTRFQRRNSGDVAIISNITDNKIRNSPEYSQAVTENIMKYALSIINPNKIVKFTVELAIGSTTDVLTDMFELYQPSLIITGAKPGKAPPTKSWATKRLSDRIVVKSPVPTIIISPINMGLYESKLFKVLDKRMLFMNKKNLNTFNEADDLLNELDNVGVYNLDDQRAYIKKTANNDTFILKELESAINELNAKDDTNGNESDSSTSTYNSESDSDNDSAIDSDNISVDSANPPAFIANKNNINTSASFKLNRLELETQIDIYRQISKLESEPITENSFKDLLTVISDSAHKYGVQLAESAKMGGEESALVRTLTEAPEQVERRKSMVSATVEEDDFNEKLKKFRQQKKLEQQQQKNGKGSKSTPKIPKINIDSNVVTPSSSFSMSSSIGLKSSKSPLSPTSSGGVLTSVSSSDAKDVKKKKKGFLSFFKS